MKSVLPALSFVLLLASCSTAYKTGQTPDDVYFSPQRPQDEYVRVDDKQDKYRYDGQGEDDRYLRMKVRNRQLWSDLDYYYSDPYAYRYNNIISPYYYYSSPWNYYNSWNYYYNPYATKVVVVNQKSPVYNRPRMTNLDVYNNNNTTDYNTSDRHISPGKVRVFGSPYSGENSSNSTNRNSVGESLRNVFSSNSSNTNSSSSNNAPARSTPAPSTSTNSSSTSSSSSSSSSNAPVRKF